MVAKIDLISIGRERDKRSKQTFMLKYAIEYDKLAISLCGDKITKYSTVHFINVNISD